MSFCLCVCLLFFVVVGHFAYVHIKSYICVCLCILVSFLFIYVCMYIISDAGRRRSGNYCMEDDEGREFTKALQSGNTLLVEGHSGHRLRLYYDALSSVAAKAGIGGERAPVPLLISSLKCLFNCLRRLDFSRRYVFFVNRDLCAPCEVRQVLCQHYGGAATRLQTLTLRQLHHRCGETLKLLEALEQKCLAKSTAVNFRYSLADVSRHPLIIPEECGMSGFASRLHNSTDATLNIGVVDVRSYCSKWMPDLDKRSWTDTFVFERTWPSDPCGDFLLIFRGVVETLINREVVLIDVSDPRESVERVALCLALSSREEHRAKEFVERIVTGTRGMGWVLVAQTATTSSFDMPQRRIDLWCGARVVFRDGRMGTVKGFDNTSFCCSEKAGWPVVMLDGGSTSTVVLPSITFLPRPLNLRVSELPFRYADTMTVEELFLTPRVLLEKRFFVLRPSLFLVVFHIFDAHLRRCHPFHVWR
ncbi:hypothetical protein MOQ_002967 [Trypanosoma cruzi marinkellei]|uniref:Uncharacterized protein n=1 Tax=Trypanosoma cruzi marinkellei TaxID=85056 RepID=K2N178_TRYCR|nr:hypothetical protein MOQ_002967 [Trypanosoma cruzi marinkellei]